MSFSTEVKEELSEHLPSARHCRIAELAAMVFFGSEITFENQKVCIIFHFELQCVADKCKRLIKHLFHERVEVCIIEKKSAYGRYIIRVDQQDLVKDIAAAIKIYNQFESFMELEEKTVLKEQSLLWDPMIVKMNCCKRAFLRGAFLMSGSISDPNKAYHFEIVTNEPAIAKRLKEMYEGFSLEAKITKRKRYDIVYMKEGSVIVDVLNIMEAHKSLMEMENVRILKDVRNSVNRRVNCETANLNKTVSAAMKQIEDIRFIEENKGLNSLTPTLLEIAELRLEQPDASLIELGELLDPPVSKSCVNHRLRKISEIAENLRDHSYML